MFCPNEGSFSIFVIAEVTEFFHGNFAFLHPYEGVPARPPVPSKAKSGQQF